MKKSIPWLRRAQAQIIVVVGPNASGKSALGIKIAKKYNGEIISADSRQIYKGLNIGSGKITKKEMKGVPHHCLDIANPKKVFSAQDFMICAQKAITDILSRGKTPIIVGGTGFYIDAALGRMKLGGVPPNPKLRKKLSRFSVEKLLATLKKLDPQRAKTIEQKNPVRLIRAIEIASAKHASPRMHGYFSAEKFLVLAPSRSQGILEDHALPKEETNDTLNGFFAGFGTVPERGEGQNRAKSSEPRAGEARMSEENALGSTAKITWIGIKRPPEELKKRIHKRLLIRLPGIIREVKNLHKKGVSWKRLFDLGLEYRFASLFLRGNLTKEQMVQQLEIAIWHYAKRQMTWFKKNKEIRWISL